MNVGNRHVSRCLASSPSSSFLMCVEICFGWCLRLSWHNKLCCLSVMFAACFRLSSWSAMSLYFLFLIHSVDECSQWIGEFSVFFGLLPACGSLLDLRWSYLFVSYSRIAGDHIHQRVICISLSSYWRSVNVANMRVSRRRALSCFLYYALSAVSMPVFMYRLFILTTWLGWQVYPLPSAVAFRSFRKRKHRFSINKQAAITTFISAVFEFVAKSLLLNFAGDINRCRFTQLSVYFSCLPFFFTRISTLCLPRKSLLPAPGSSEFLQVAGLYFIFLFHSPSKASPAKDRANTQSTKWVFRIVLDALLTWFQAKARTYCCLVWFRNVRCLIIFLNIAYFFSVDSEVIEKPTPAKKKRVYLFLPCPRLCKVWRRHHSVAADRNATPPPNSQAYKDLPAVSVSWALSTQFLLFLTYLFRCRSLVLAAMKSAVTSSGGTPTFDLQELQDTRYIDAILCFLPVM
jgi:hypothetical protein